jgi:amino acid transporter
MSVLTRLLPLAVVAAAICLFASELMVTFEFTPPGAEALLEQDGADRHGNALALIAVFAIGAVGVAVFAQSRPAATAAAIAGVVALLVLLIADLPDANAVGTLDDPRQSYFSAEAVPREGFWLALISSVALALTGTALATLTSEQLTELRPGRRTGEHDEPGDSGKAEGASQPSQDGERPSRRPRPRRRSREPR